jgi:hypothetical protein
MHRLSRAEVLALADYAAKLEVVAHLAHGYCKHYYKRWGTEAPGKEMQAMEDALRAAGWEV